MKRNKGIIITLILIFGFIFLILLGGLLSFILFQLKKSEQRLAWDQALYIAEAGVDYYKWCSNNNSECLLEKEYLDKNGATLGSFSLEVNTELSCGELVKKRISSVGWTSKFPQTKRQVGALYARESVAKYAFLLNANVWAGEDIEIRGLYHSNGGIRMDGENQSLVSSAQEEWVCTSSFGCSTCPVSFGCRIDGSNCICPAVFTTTNNSNPDLFDFPVSSFDFDGITVDLAKIKSLAQTSSIYLPPSIDINPQAKGYHIKFNQNGTFEVWIITSLSSSWAYSLEESWHYDYFIIASEYLYNTYTPSSSCSAIFIEDNIWLEGKVKGKITLASADLIDPNKDTDVVLPNNIEYTVFDGSDGLSIVSERNVLISPASPENMEIRGIFIAQKGRFGRNHYPNNFREKLEITGSIVSNGRVGTKWSSGSQIISGYLDRENYIDSNLVYDPPPFVPYVSLDFKLVDWEEEE